jgi:hypothetical protein
MGVIIKYLLDFKSAGFTVSNDLLEGDFIIDASVEAKMMRGPEGGKFEIKLYDLPEDKADALYKKSLGPGDASVVINLGYMDGEFGTVMEGIYTNVTAQVVDNSLITTLTGDESATYVLKHTRFHKGFDGNIKFTDAVAELLKHAPFESSAPSSPSSITGALAAALGNGASGSLIDKVPKVENIPDDEFEDISLKGENLMVILDNLARNAHAEFLVCDKKIHIGKPVTNGPYKPDEFDPDVNLAQFRPIAKNLPGEEGDNRLIKLPPHQALGFKFTIAGDPQLRPGQRVFAKVETKVEDKIEGYREKNGADFRIHSVTHKLTMSGGYVCEGKAAKTCTDNNCRRQQDALGLGDPDAFVQALSQRNKDELRRNPAVEVGAVKQYKPGEASAAPHRSTLYFGQRFAKTETQPSVRAEAEADDNQVLRNKPIVSPFAWHKCGLVVPVYPGMKALLSHNLNLPDDALVTGFLWSEKPMLEPPKNKEGDWWLCLPIDFDTSSPPSDSTKAANDLIANTGRRVIEVKGLKITVGKDSLGSVGERPTEGEDDEFLIEHKSGTKFKIAADGSLSIEASSVSIKGDVTIEGNVEIT